MKRVLIIPDVHSKNYDKKAWGAMIAYARSHPFTHVVFLGDLLEGDAVSAHNKGKLKLLEGQRLADDYAFAGKLLDEVRGAVGDSADITLIKGNHEWRVDRYIEEHPEMDGLINVEKGLDLKRRNVRLVEAYPKGQLFRIGKLYFTHGIYIGGNHAKKHVDVFGVNIVYGHTHEVAIHSKVQYGKGKAHAAYNLGCLCRYDQAYLAGSPTNWQHAFGEAFVRDDGKFHLNIYTIFDGETVVGGKVYRQGSNILRRTKEPFSFSAAMKKEYSAAWDSAHDAKRHEILTLEPRKRQKAREKTR